MYNGNFSAAPGFRSTHYVEQTMQNAHELHNQIAEKPSNVKQEFVERLEAKVAYLPQVFSE